MQSGEGAEKNRATCEEHGLTYDPQTHTGCVMCRRPAQGSMTKNVAALFAVVAIVGAIGAAAYTYKLSRRAAVGQPCDGTYGCVDGAGCIAVGIVPSLSSEGTCYEECAAGGACRPGHECKHLDEKSYCVEVAAAGAACGGGVMCAAGSACIRPPGGAPACRKRCIDMNCPDGLSCQFVSDGVVPTSHEMYCLP